MSLQFYVFSSPPPSLSLRPGTTGSWTQSLWTLSKYCWHLWSGTAWEHLTAFHCGLIRLAPSEWRSTSTNQGQIIQTHTYRRMISEQPMTVQSSSHTAIHCSWDTPSSKWHSIRSERCLKKMKSVAPWQHYPFCAMLLTRWPWLYMWEGTLRFKFQGLYTGKHPIPMTVVVLVENLVPDTQWKGVALWQELEVTEALNGHVWTNLF